jgi:hypothetical protein
MTTTSNTIVVNKRQQAYDVYIGRGSKWGNPYTHMRGPTKAEFHVESREQAIALYRKYILSHPELLSALPELAGKRLGCYCKPLACHGDVLVELLEERMRLHGGAPSEVVGGRDRYSSEADLV